MYDFSQAKAIIDDETKDWDPAKDANVVVSLPAAFCNMEEFALRQGRALCHDHMRSSLIYRRETPSRPFLLAASVLMPLRRN